MMFDPGLAATRQEVRDWIEESEAKLLDAINREFSAQDIRKVALGYAHRGAVADLDEMLRDAARIEAYLRDGTTAQNTAEG
jgi:hypothetical protein